MEQVLQINKLCKGYQDGGQRLDVLSDLSFDLQRGQSLAITGPSGSGKSTLLNILAGIVSADTGECILQVDQVAHGLHALDETARTQLRRRYIGYVHQFYNLVPTLTVLENVCLPAYLNKRKDLYAQAHDLLAQFSLADRAGVFPQVLSGGEQQRVAVARALLLKPPLLLADEPTGNLDADNAARVSELLFAQANQLGVSVVVATHSQEIAQQADIHLHLGMNRG